MMNWRAFWALASASNTWTDEAVGTENSHSQVLATLVVSAAVRLQPWSFQLYLFRQSINVLACSTPTEWNVDTHLNKSPSLHFLLSFSITVQGIFLKVLGLRFGWAAFVPQNFSITVNQWPTKPLTLTYHPSLWLTKDRFLCRSLIPNRLAGFTDWKASAILEAESQNRLLKSGCRERYRITVYRVCECECKDRHRPQRGC